MKKRSFQVVFIAIVILISLLTTSARTLKGTLTDNNCLGDEAGYLGSRSEASRRENVDMSESWLFEGEPAENAYARCLSGKVCEVKEYNIPLRDTIGTHLRQRNGENSIELSVSTGTFKSVTVEFKNANWQMIFCDNTENLNAYGKPTLPYKKLLIPLNDTEVVDVTIDKELLKEFAEVDVLPGLKSLPVGSNYLGGLTPEGYLEKNFYADPSIYQSDRAFPLSAVAFETVTYGTERFLVLKVYPFEFQPTRSKIRVFDVHINVEISRPALGERGFSSGPLEEEEDPGYVIVIPSAFSSAVEPFAAWKEQLGFSVQKTTLEYVYNNFSGRDRPEKLREFIKESYYTNGTEYYLLVGDCDICPAREVWDPAMGPGLDNGTEPSDLYFECLDGDWDADGDSVFGEMEDDVDFYPEVKVGRLPVNTVQEAATVCRMIKKIEEDPEPGDWIKKFLLIANTAFTYGDSAAALDEEIHQKFLADSFFDVIRLYDVDGSLSTSAVTSAMNQGVGLVDFFDHGNYETWVGALRTSDVLSLLNGNKTFLAFAMACETAAFDYQQYTTIAEAFFKNPNGGAIAYIGATRVAWAGYDRFDGLHHRFWRNLLTQATANTEAHPKDALQAALIEMASTYDMIGASRETVYQTIYFGDPALNLYWKHNITTTATPDLETEEAGTISGICQLLHSGIPITGQYQAVVRDPIGELITQQFGTLGVQGNYTVDFTTSTLPGNYTIETSVANPFNYTHSSGFNVGTLNVTLESSSIPVYGNPLEVSGQVLDEGTPVPGQVNVSIVDDGVILESKVVAVNASGQYETQINMTTLGRQELHVWASNLADTKHGGASTALKLKRGDVLILVDDSGDMTALYPGGWYDLNRGSSTSYHYFYASLEDDYNVSVYRILYDPVPDLNLLQQYSAVVVTCGDHYGACLTSGFRHLTEVLTKYHNSGGNLLFEGGDLAYSLLLRGYTTFMGSVLHATFIGDVHNTGLFLNNSVPHPVTQGLPSLIHLEGGLGSPSVDLAAPANESEMVSGYVGYAGGSIIAFSGQAGLGSMVYFSFSIDGIVDVNHRELLIKNSIGYITVPTLTAWLSDYALQVNTTETIQVQVSDANTGQRIKNATVIFTGCGVSAQNTTNELGECSIFVAPTSSGIIGVMVQKAGYLDFTAQIVVYSLPRFMVDVTPEHLKKETQTVDVSITDFYEKNSVADVNVTLVGCGVFETGYTNVTGDIQFAVTPTSYGHIRLNASKAGYEDYTTLMGVHIRAVVVDSFGTDYPEYSLWDDLNYLWESYGTIPIQVDTESLDKYGITYEDLVESEADVLIIPCAAAVPREYTTSEISAIKNYTLEGHGLIGTAGTLYTGVPNNNKLAPLFGMREDGVYTATWFSSLNILASTHPLFVNIPSPYYVGTGTTVCPQDLSWDTEDLLDGEYIALSGLRESAIVVHNGVVFIGHWVGYYSNSYDLQLMYNAITWSKYQVPEHDLKVTLEVPDYMKPNCTTVVSATVSNLGLNNETDVDLFLLINGTTVASARFSELLTGTSSAINYSWTPNVEGIYNVTAYAPPVPGENRTWNNCETRFVGVFEMIIAVVLDSYGTDYASSCFWDYLSTNWATYGDVRIAIDYTSLNKENITLVDIEGTHADVLIISDAWSDTYYFGWEFSDSEIEAIKTYVSGDHGIVATSGTFDTWSAPNNQKLAELFGMDPTVWYNWGINGEQRSTRGIFDLLAPRHEELWRNIPDPYISDPLVTLNPTPSLDWTIQGVTTGWIEALSTDHYAAVITSERFNRKGVYFTCMLEGEGQYNENNRQLFYNAIVWTQLPPHEHDLAVALDSPAYLEPSDSVLLNTTVYNIGLNNETGVQLRLLIDGIVVNNVTVDELLAGSSYTLNYSWAPTLEGVYNVTGYAVPVPGENVTTNNICSKMTRVTHFRRVLFDQTHGTDSISNYYTWVTDLKSRSYIIDAHISGPITSSVLADYDVFVIPQAHYFYTPDELTAIQNFVAGGGGLLVIGDDYPDIYTDLTSFAGVSWMDGGVYGVTTDITPHLVTHGVTSVYLSSPITEMTVSGLAQDLVRDTAGGIMLAVSEHPGKVIGFADENSLWDYGISQEDNLLLANNMIDWLTIRYEHDLAAALDAPAFLEPGDSVLLNATVHNVGLNNETDVELFLLINGTTANYTMIQELSAGSSYSISYLWTPVEGVYNVTAYSPPVLGEDFTQNNVMTKIVPIIRLPHVFVDPSVNTIVINETFTINLKVADVTNLYGLDIQLSWDPTIIRYVSHKVMIPVEDHPGGVLHEPVLEIKDEVDESGVPDANPGTLYWLACASMLPAPTFNGSGIMASFTFKAVSMGVSDLSFTYTILCDRDAMPILHVALNGLVEVVKRPPLIHDIAIVSVTPSRTEVYAGRTANVTVVAKNEGNATETFDVTAYYENTSIATQTVIDLAPSEEIPLIFSWDTTGVQPCINYTVGAEASMVPGETNTDNNLLVDGEVHVKMLGDVNGDGNVNIYDIVLAATAYGSRLGDENWNPDVDLAPRYGFINIYDLVTITALYGTCLP